MLSTKITKDIVINLNKALKNVHYYTAFAL